MYNCLQQCKKIPFTFNKRLWYYDIDQLGRHGKSCHICGYYIFTNEIKCPCCSKPYKTIKKLNAYKYKTIGFVYFINYETGETIKVERSNLEIKPNELIERLQASCIST